jgi:hypothetical protein
MSEEKIYIKISRLEIYTTRFYSNNLVLILGKAWFKSFDYETETYIGYFFINRNLFDELILSEIALNNKIAIKLSSFISENLKKDVNEFYVNFKKSFKRFLLLKNHYFVTDNYLFEDFMADYMEKTFADKLLQFLSGFKKGSLNRICFFLNKQADANKMNLKKLINYNYGTYQLCIKNGLSKSDSKQMAEIDNEYAEILIKKYNLGKL